MAVLLPFRFHDRRRDSILFNLIWFAPNSPIFGHLQDSIASNSEAIVASPEKIDSEQPHRSVVKLLLRSARWNDTAGRASKFFGDFLLAKARIVQEYFHYSKLEPSARNDKVGRRRIPSVAVVERVLLHDDTSCGSLSCRKHVASETRSHRNWIDS